MASKHYLADFFKSKGYSVQKGEVLKGADVNSAKLALQLDEDTYLVNALVSFATSITSINKKCFSWAFIESYYALFYIAKALLAENGVAIVYNGSKPFMIKLMAGNAFEKRDGNSHDVILKEYKSTFAGDTFLCGTINGTDVIEWFNDKRNEINYKLSPLTEPEPPEPLFHYASDSLHKWITKYIDDNAGLYVFDESHCYVAYTMRLIMKVVNYYQDSNRHNPYIDNKFFSYLKANLKDKKGELNALLTEIAKIKS